MRELVRPLLRATPEAFGERYAALVALKAAFVEELAAALQPAIQAHYAAQPHGGLAEKQRVAASVNTALREIGLTLKCPKSGRPALLVVDLKDSANRDVSRFRFETRDDRGHKARLGTTTEFPDLELVADPVRREPLSRGVGPGGTGPGDGRGS